MSFCWALISIWVLVSALAWPFRTALFPIVAGVFVLITSATEFYLDAFASPLTKNDPFVLVRNDP